MMLPLDSPPPEEIRQNIEAVKAIDLRSAAMDEIKTRLAALMKGFSNTALNLHPGAHIYRGVICSKRPANIARISYPPPERITKLQRANRPGRPMFYAAFAREVPFFELSPNPGDYLAISKWRTTASIPTNCIAQTPTALQALGSAREKPAFENKLAPPAPPSNRMIEEYFASEFCRIVPPGEEHLYKITAAIAEKYVLDPIIAGGDRSIDDLGTGFGGLTYPTIAMRGNADNLVLLPDFVDRCLSLVSVEWVEIESKGPDFKYQINKLDYADSFGADGTIEWKGRLPHWVVQEPGELHFTAEEGRWVARDQNGRIIDPR